MNNYRRGFGGFTFFPPVIKYLLISNIAIFLLEFFFLDFLKVGRTSVGEVFLKNFALFGYDSPFFRPWQVFTYMYMHGSFSHLFFNMFALWMFGMELENLWGSKTFFIYYTVCGIGAGLANAFLAPLFTSLPPNVPTVGASGSIYGVLIAFGMLFPNRYIYIYFMLPLKAKYLVIIYMAVEVFAVASQSQSGIAHVAHLGGAVVGFLYVYFYLNRGPRKFSRTGDSNVFDNLKNVFEKKDKEANIYDIPKRDITDAEFEDLNKSKYEDDVRQKEREAQERIDAILDKLSARGYSSLTDEEKKILFQESKRLR
ncbi:MAG TPA: rhomboid family intramembrane serine protease [Ignavibacteria bacterium]|nr:rhomboid family intramembrane serine protease [Ignavibacteria bacterium]